jgi:hypothetical protein
MLLRETKGKVVKSFFLWGYNFRSGPFLSFSRKKCQAFCGWGWKGDPFRSLSALVLPNPKSVVKRSWDMKTKRDMEGDSSSACQPRPRSTRADGFIFRETHLLTSNTDETNAKISSN